MPPDAVAIKALKLKINNDDLTGAAAYGQDRKAGEKTRDISKVTLH
jgi:hypothetical protein